MHQCNIAIFYEATTIEFLTDSQHCHLLDCSDKVKYFHKNPCSRETLTCSCRIYLSVSHCQKYLPLLNIPYQDNISTKTSDFVLHECSMFNIIESGGFLFATYSYYCQQHKGTNRRAMQEEKRCSHKFQAKLPNNSAAGYTATNY